MRNNVKHQNSQNNSASKMPQKLYRRKYANVIEILHLVNYHARNILKRTRLIEHVKCIRWLQYSTKFRKF